MTREMKAGWFSRFGVGRNGYISLTGFPTTFIIDMAFLSSTLYVHK